MDLKQTGAFIKQERKAKGLTQTQLAEKLFVSEKTISKWECGKGFPDTSLILPLCKALDINANELLSSKRLKEDEYKQQAEQNLLALQEKNLKTDKFLLTLEYVLGYMSSISLFVLVFVASYATIATWLRIALIAFGFLHLIFGIHFCLIIEKDAGFYQCQHCGHKYIPEYKNVLWSMHMGRTRFMKCPHCHKKSWQKKVIK